MNIKKFSTSSTLYIAHRGESKSAPENTLEAINLAWQNGADGIEIDVHLSADNEIIVNHDKSTKRMTGEYRLIRRNNLAEIKKLNVKKNGYGYNYDVKIPTLIEALKTVPKGKYIFIEVKCGIEILPRLKQILKKTSVDVKYIKIISFNLGVISAIKKALPQYKTLWVMRIGIEKSALFLNGLSSIIFESGFRLQGPGNTIGCVAACHSSDWWPVKSILNHTSTTKVPDNATPWWRFWSSESVKKYGTMEVR